MAIQTKTTANGAESRKPFAKLETMLREGKLRPGPTGRRYMPMLNEDSNLSLEQMAEIGNRGGRFTGLRRIRPKG